jgi:polyvinyl alcohol dehydrogenase (cytochrome)
MIGAATTSPTKMCAKAAWFDAAQPPALDGWGLDANNAHSIPHALAGLDRASVGKLRLKWALAFPDVLYARSQPAFAGGAIFVGSDNGTIYALDPASGCAHWAYHAGGPVRSGLVVDGWKAGDKAARPLVHFGDMLGRAYALDARTGALVWQRAMDAHPNATLTAAPALHDGVLYVAVSSLEEPAAGAATHECCTFRGSLVALDAATGEEKWRAWMVDTPTPRGKNASGTTLFGPSGVAIWSTPLIDAKRGLVYVATGDNYSAPATRLSDSIVALDIKTGAVRWAYQATGADIWNAACGYSAGGGNCPEDAGPDYDFGSAPIMARGADGHDYVLAGQKSGILYAVDPDSGALRWKKRVGRGGVFGGIHFGIAAANGKVFVPMADMADGKEYDQPARPGVFALDVASGKELWAAPAGDTCGAKPFCQPGYGAAISVTPDFVLAGSMDGHVRIFDAANGKVLRDIDTAVPYVTVNGSEARGGSMAGGSAPIAWHGKLIVTSGYGGLGKMPGNAMLVFDAK